MDSYIQTFQQDADWDPLEALGADIAHFLSNAKRRKHTWIWGMMHEIRDTGKGYAAIPPRLLDSRLWGEGGAQTGLQELLRSWLASGSVRRGHRPSGG